VIYSNFKEEECSETPRETRRLRDRNYGSHWGPIPTNLHFAPMGFMMGPGMVRANLG
jgi:hypothetical protein